MKLQEIFLVETTEDDNNLIKSSAELFNIIMRYADYDSSFLSLVKLGKLGAIVKNPPEGLEDIRIVLMSNNRLAARAKSVSAKRSVIGIWDPEIHALVLNSDRLTSPKIRTAITHELRHALDDIKSNYRAGKSIRYSTPKNKEFRSNPEQSYDAEPTEINARFTELLHDIHDDIVRVSGRFSPTVLRSKLIAFLPKYFDRHNLSFMFPEKDQSKDYRRLVNRAISYIDSQINQG
jgi:hypothetical protein